MVTDAFKPGDFVSIHDSGTPADGMAGKLTRITCTPKGRVSFVSIERTAEPQIISVRPRGGLTLRRQ